MIDHLEIMKQGLDNKYNIPADRFMLSDVIDTANSIKKIFSLTAEQLDECVEIVKNKLQELLHHEKRMGSNRHLGDMELYKQDTERTKTVMFMIDENQESIQTLFGEFLDAPEDYKSKEKINKELEEFRRENNYKQAKSAQEAQRVFIS